MIPSVHAAEHTARALRVAGEYRKRALDPNDRFSEVLFGLIMVLAFTCSLSVAKGGAEDLWGALGSALLVMAATLPPILPFLLVADAGRALRISNGVAVASLFLVGLLLGRACGLRPWLLGLAMVVLGTVLVAITIALGG